MPRTEGGACVARPRGACLREAEQVVRAARVLGQAAAAVRVRDHREQAWRQRVVRRWRIAVQRATKEGNLTGYKHGTYEPKGYLDVMMKGVEHIEKLLNSDPIGFDGIGGCKEAVSCDFGSDWFDLKVIGFNGKNYRLVKRNLDKNIVPAESKALVKKNSIKICLRKVRVGQPRGRHVSLALVVFTRVTRAGEGRVRRGHVARPDGEARKGRREREGEGPERVDHGHDEAECATHPADA